YEMGDLCTTRSTPGPIPRARRRAWSSGRHGEPDTMLAWMRIFRQPPRPGPHDPRRIAPVTLNVSVFIADKRGLVRTGGLPATCVAKSLAAIKRDPRSPAYVLIFIAHASLASQGPAPVR